MLMLDYLFCRDTFLNNFKQSDEGNTVATLTFVMSDKFLHSLVCLGHTHPYLNRGVKNFKTVRNSCHLLKLLVTLESNV